ncbi:NACHT domain-containing protein, partial [Bacteroides ovatus]
NQNFDNVTRYNNCIVGEQKIMGRKTVCLFALFPQKLSGITNEEVEIVYKGIESLQNKYSANLVFVVSLQTISNGFKNTLMKKSTNISPTYIERNELISLIDEYYSDFWRHEDQDLLAYEKTLLNFIQEDTELRKLNFSQDKYKQKLIFFIEPQLSRCYEDKKTKTIVRSKYKIDDIIKQKQSLIIQGEAGCGKSTLLKRIIKHLIDENSALKEKKNLPIYLSSQDIISSIEDIKFLIQDKLKIILGEAPLNEIKDKYYIHLLIDSIDELEDFHSVIFEQLEKLKEKYNIKYYVASRNVDMLLQNVGNANVEIYDIRRFNFEQIKHFLNAFFSGEEIKASNLLEALRENKIIDKLPVTPLDLYLISILFEEKDFEIPATISDIYDNFNSLIIGRAVVSSRVEFVDISFKERILSIYALE